MSPADTPDPRRLLERIAARCDDEWLTPGLSPWHDAALLAQAEAERLLQEHFPDASNG